MADTIKGRGSRQYLPGRFETTTVEAADDGWAPLAEPEAGPDPSRPRTEVQEEIARSIVTRNRSPDVGFSQSVNPYRGCEHGCSYCFARPSHAYLNLSPGLDFETKIFAKTNAPELLRREFARPGYREFFLDIATDHNVGTLTLRKSGTDQHVYSLSTSQSWVWMNPPYGSTQTISTETDQLVITAQTTGLSAGTYSATVYIVDSGPNNYSNTIRIPVTFTVAATAAPATTSPAPSQPAVTTPPSPTPTPVTPIPNGSVSPSPAPARTANATVTWNANTEADLAGYRVYVGTTSGSYNFAGPFEVSGATSFTVPNLPVGTTYFFAVTAFDKSGNESTKSSEVSKSLF